MFILNTKEGENKIEIDNKAINNLLLPHPGTGWCVDGDRVNNKKGVNKPQLS